MIAEKCLGPISGTILNSLIVFAIFGIMSLYMILFSEIAISLLGSSAGESFFDQKSFYVVTLGVLIAPIISQKKIAKLKFSTYVLIFGVISLIMLLTIVLLTYGSYEYRVEQGLIDSIVSEVDVKVGVFEGVMDSVNIAVASQGFIIALFPIYSEYPIC